VRQIGNSLGNPLKPNEPQLVQKQGKGKGYGEPYDKPENTHPQGIPQRPIKQSGFEKISEMFEPYPLLVEKTK
jgi:hypothetical protein